MIFSTAAHFDGAFFGTSNTISSSGSPLKKVMLALRTL